MKNSCKTFSSRSILSLRPRPSSQCGLNTMSYNRRGILARRMELPFFKFSLTYVSL